jgi:oxygen-independent coproporphyrinogen III oxidase
MTPEIVLKYSGPVPRYTSYPTAPHFRTTVAAETAAAWLEALPATTALSLYLHIPFCRSLCWFCGCHTKITRRDAPVERYLATLFEEIALVARRLGAPRRVAHIHLGGGSPSLLPPDDLRRLAETLHRRFAIAGNAEFAIEIDPRTIDDARAAALAEIGVNRVSLGVQDFDPTVQRAINRVQPFELTARVVDALRGRGIGGLNLDLMYGLPLQTLGGMARTVEQAIGLAPDRLALFGYAHVPWLKKHQNLIHAAELPGPWERWCQAQAAARGLAAAGYVPIGLDHFARPEDPLARAAAEGTLRRNFQGYTADPAGALLGFGASAIGSLPAGFLQNHPDLKAYDGAVSAGRLPTARGLAVTREDGLRAAVIERLMCALGADVGAVCRSFGFPADHLDDALWRLNALAADGLVEVAGRRVTVPEHARLLVRNIAACFDAYLQPSEQPRHAQGV